MCFIDCDCGVSVHFSLTSRSGCRQCKAGVELCSCPGCRLLPVSSLPPSGRGPGVYGPTQHSGPHLPVLIQGGENGTTPPPSLYDVQGQAHTPSAYITGPHLAAQVSRNEVFIRSSPVPTKSQRLCYSRKEARPWGTPHRCCLNSASSSAHRLANLQTEEMGRRKGQVLARRL